MTIEQWIPVRRRPDGTQYDDRSIRDSSLANLKRRARAWDAEIAGWTGKTPDAIVDYALTEFEDSYRVLASYL